MIIDTPIGPLTLVAGPRDGLAAIRFGSEPGLPDGGACEQAARQLHEYFAGERETFDLPLEPAGSGFELTVWDALCRIPYGTTKTYGDVATEIGHEGKARAVGWANGRNPHPIVVPCHRVIGAGGKLTGYGGGLDVKEHLLRHEGALLL